MAEPSALPPQGQERRRAAPTDGRVGDRRQVDRRKGDRRRPVGRTEDESWFGALGMAADSQSDGRESFFDPGWLAAGDTPPDSRFISREARRVVAAHDNALAAGVPNLRCGACSRRRGAGGRAGHAGSLLGARPLLASVLLCIAYAVQAITLVAAAALPAAGRSPGARPSGAACNGWPRSGSTCWRSPACM
jgi:hypothetical protein